MVAQQIANEFKEQRDRCDLYKARDKPDDFDWDQRISKPLYQWTTWATLRKKTSANLNNAPARPLKSKHRGAK